MASKTKSTPPRVRGRDKIRALRVAVAEEVLKWIDVADICTGSYIDARSVVGGIDGDMRERWDEVVRKCRLCHLGAGIVAKARLIDKVKMSKLFHETSDETSDFYDGNSADSCDQRGYIYDQMDAIYGKKTRQLMETAFECDSFCGDDAEKLDEDGCMALKPKPQAAVDFGGLFNNARERSRAIWLEVVHQKGRFDPESALRHWRPKLTRQRARRRAWARR